MADAGIGAGLRAPLGPQDAVLARMHSDGLPKPLDRRGARSAPCSMRSGVDQASAPILERAR